MRKLNNHGFTLIEVLIVVTIFAVGAAIAIPQITEMGKRAQVKSAARQLKDQMARTRISAIEQNVPIVFVFDSIVAGVGSLGYQIVQDNDGDCEIDGGEQISRIDISNAAITVNTLSVNDTGKSIIQWDRRGFPRKKDGTLASGTISFSGAGTQLDVSLSQTGNIRID